MPHYYSEKQDSDPDIKKISLNVGGNTFEVYSASGLFSKDRLDIGTKLLIEKAIINSGWKVLDLGCSYGAVGISVKKRYPDSIVIMSDINERAVMISRKNILLHRLEGIKSVKSNVFSNINETFDTILLNPPQTAGKDLCFRMIIESKEHLEKGGLLQLVARHNKGGSTLKGKMQEVFGNAEDIANSSGYRVYISRNC